MARKAEPGISYYRMNTGWTTNKKVRLVFNEFDSHGIWIWSCIVDLAYKQKGYFLDCNDHDALELFATDVCKKPVSLVEEVIAGCVRRGLFNKAVFDLFGILTSVMMQDVYMDATNERRKKGSVLDLHEDYLLIKISDSEKGIHILPGKKSIPPGRKEEIHGSSTQSREEESKEDKSNSAPDIPAPPISSGKGKKEKLPEPYWNLLVAVWYGFVEKNFGQKPLFADQDPRLLQSIVQKLKKKSASQNEEWTELSAVHDLKNFLSCAFQEQWLKDNFLLKRLNDQFEKIGRKPVAGAIGLPVYDIKFLFEKFKKNELDPLLINDEHYQSLEDAKVITKELRMKVRKRRADQLVGSNKAKELLLMDAYLKGTTTEETKADAPALRKLAVLEFFKQLKETGSEAVFIGN